MDNEYEDIISRGALNKQDTKISNSSIKHKLIGLKYLIRNAENNVRVFSDEFYDSFWSRLEYPLGNFLSKEKSSLEIVVLKRCLADGIISRLSKSHPEKVSLFKFNRPDLVGKSMNYVTIDSCGYRFERSDEEKKGKMIHGIINYGDKSITEKFNELFEDIKLRSNLVRLEGSLKGSPIFLGDRKFFSSSRKKSFY